LPGHGNPTLVIRETVVDLPRIRQTGGVKRPERYDRSAPTPGASPALSQNFTQALVPRQVR
ncbi:MAG: hypothetical protein KDA38_13105, partial [Planctomycetales bacterium]|nr:hypothetical protein [Planctomycetales bacterium]